MNECGEITMFRLKPLKSSTVPLKWVVVHFDGNNTTCAFCTCKNEEWKVLPQLIGGPANLEYIASQVRTKEITWLVGEGLYEWLCSQDLYRQIVAGKASLPLGNSNSNMGKLTGQFATGDPCIIDLVFEGKRLHCIDFGNWGIHDVKSIDHAVQSLRDYVRMVSDLDMGTIKSTAAAQGAARFRSRDIDDHRIYCHQVPEVRRLERDAFYGGRAECLTLGQVDGTVYDLDAVSMHPTIGLEEKFPVKLIDLSPFPANERLLKHYRAGRHIFARVKLRTPSPDYPVRMKLPGGGERTWTIYPTGEFETVLPGPEFAHALESDRIIEVKEWAAYDTARIFKENSEWFFDIKDRLEPLGLSHMKDCLKLAQNAFYGNMGRRGRRWINGIKWHDAEWGMWWGRHPVIGNVVAWRAIAGVHQYLDSGGEPETSCPAISATMFSYCRVRLLAYIQTAGRENTHYYDSDGLAVNCKGAVKLHSRHNELRIKKQSDDVEFRGIKYYRFDDVWTHAGVPTWAERLPDGSARFPRHEPFNFGMWHAMPFQHKYILAANDPFPKYRHGIVAHGGRVSPFVLPFKEKIDGSNEKKEK